MMCEYVVIDSEESCAKPGLLAEGQEERMIGTHWVVKKHPDLGTIVKWIP